MKKIALDLDDVLIDFVSVFIDYHNDEYKTSFEWRAFDYDDGYYEVLDVKPEEVSRRFKGLIKSKYIEHIKPFSYSIKLIKELKKKGFYPIIITGRQQEREQETKNVFEKYFSEVLDWKDVYFGNDFHPTLKNKGKHEICLEEDIKIIVEDTIKHGKICADNKILTLLLDRPWNQNVEDSKYLIRIKDRDNPIPEVMKALKNES